MAPRLKAPGKTGAPAAASGAPDDVQDLAPDVQTFLENFGEGAATVLLFRREEALGEEAYVGSIPVGGFDLDKIAERYGGGRYRLQLKDSNRKFIKGSSRVFAIAGPSKHPNSPAPIVGTLPTVSDPLALRLDRLEQALQRPPADPLETAIKLMGMFKEAIIPHTQTPASEMAAAFREGMQLMKEAGSLSGGRDDDDGDKGYSLVLETVGRPLAKLLERRIDEEAEERRRRPPALPSPRTAPAAIAPPRAPAPAAPVAESAPGMWWLKLRPYIPKLIRLAKEDRDTYGWARVILEELDDNTVTKLQGVLHDEKLIDMIATVVPEAAVYRDWLTRFFEDVAAILEDDDGDDLDSADVGDNGSGPASDSLEGDPEPAGGDGAAVE